MPLSRVWVVVAFAFPAAVLAAVPLTSVDLTYLIRTGDVMVDSGHLVRTDILTFTARGLPWLNQQWASEIVLALVFRGGGWFALAAARVALSLGVLAFVYLACRQQGVNHRQAAWWTLGSAVLMAPAGFQLRAQLFGLLMFAACAWLVVGRTSHPRRLWWVVPIVVVWANLHGSFFLGPGLLGLAWLEDLFEQRPGGRHTLTVGVAALVATIVTPFGPRVWPYAIGIATNSQIRTSVEEWQPPTLGSYSGAAFLLSMIATGVYLARRSSRTRSPALASLVVFAVIGLVALRSVCWWFIAAPIVLCSVGLAGPHRAPRPDPRSPINVAVAAAISVIALASLLRWLPYLGSRPYPPNRVSFAPIGVTSELTGVLRPGERLFNDQAWGSWFELAIPRDPVFVDSRWDVIPRAVWQDYQDVIEGRANYQAVLDRWRIEVIVVSTDHEGLVSALLASHSWRLTYRDSNGVIFERASR